MMVRVSSPNLCARVENPKIEASRLCGKFLSIGEVLMTLKPNKHDPRFYQRQERATKVDKTSTEVIVMVELAEVGAIDVVTFDVVEEEEKQEEDQGGACGGRYHWRRH
ncbi:hypothetical protein VNO78_18612 [Psophocarpus tetragonolobus]|uniref:Uncharacterized protein n=1 Tax=Psophocarpus tetragonolobus TaxID=3891 RepID=A0AAN9XM00_PSOTE